MFEPDGRNSVQTIGHGVTSVLKFVMIVFGVLAVAPVFIYLNARMTLQIQEATIQALNDPGPSQALLVDFNTAEIGAWDGKLVGAWEAARGEGWNPGLRSLPFRAQMLTRRGYAWEPTEIPTGWVYYNLPFDRGYVYDPRYSAGIRAGVWGPRTEDIVVMEAAGHYLKGYSPLGDDEAWLFDDPWFAQGLWKLTPTKNWDWNSGFELVHAKSSYNYRAYVGAARAVAAMRYLVATRRLGGWGVTDAKRTPAAWVHREGDRFAAIYRTAFSGKLPVVLMNLQDLDARSIEHDDNWKRFKTLFGPDLDHNSRVGLRGVTKGPFVTGMSLWTGYHQADSLKGLPVYTAADFIYRSTPYVSREAREAQQALSRLLTDDFWAPLLRQEGLGTEDDLLAMHTAMNAVRASLGHDTRFCQMTAHNAYHSLDSM